jgi:two-component system, LytTR family, response regulator LytT
MVIIAVCDDNCSDRTEISTAIETYFHNQCINGKVFAYDSAEKLTSVIESKRLKFDILFLDIIMSDMDGMTCARLIRQQDKLMKIVFLTSSTDYVYEGYEVNASDYLLKPVNVRKLTAVLDKTIAQIEAVAKESISITSGGGTQRILINDIPYLESKKNQVELVLAETGERVVIYTKLDEFEQLHPAKVWIRPHKSFIVNFLYVEQYASDKFVLRDGTVIPISRTYKNKARECFYTLLHNQ